MRYGLNQPFRFDIYIYIYLYIYIHISIYIYILGWVKTYSYHVFEGTNKRPSTNYVRVTRVTGFSLIATYNHRLIYYSKQEFSYNHTVNHDRYIYVYIYICIESWYIIVIQLWIYHLNLVIQHSHWIWPFIVSSPIDSGDFP